MTNDSQNYCNIQTTKASVPSCQKGFLLRCGLQIRLNIRRATEDVVQEFVKTEFVVFLMARLLTLWKKYWECTFKVELWQHEAVVKVL